MLPAAFPRLTVITLAATAFALAACANVGPFRATHDESPDANPGDDRRDGGTSTTFDGATDGNGSGAQPQQLATSTEHPVGLAVSGGYVYWSELDDTYALARVATTGGAVKRLTVADVPFSLAASDGQLFWATTTQVVTASSSFASATPVVTSTQLHGELALAAEHVYFTRAGSTSGTTRLERVPRTGGTAEPLYEGLTSRPELATTATSLYWTGYSTAEELRRSSLGAPTTYTVDATAPIRLLAAGGTTACWITQPDVNVYSYDIWCLRQGQKRRISTGNYDVYALIVTDTDVYFATRANPSTGHIRRYVFASQATTTIETSPAGSFPTELARDGQFLYWTESHSSPEGSATMWRVALD